MPFDPSQPFRDLSQKQSGFDPNAPFKVIGPTSGGEALLRGYAQGGTLGLEDELAGVGGAVGDRLERAIMPSVESTHPDVQKQMDAAQDKYTPSFGDAYRSARDEERFFNNQAADQHEALYSGGQLASGLALPLGAPSLGKTIAQGAGIGLGQSNADLTQGEFGEAAQDAKSGALAAGLGYGAAKTVGPLAVGGTKTIAQGVQKADEMFPGMAGALIGGTVGHGLLPGHGTVIGSIVGAQLGHGKGLQKVIDFLSTIQHPDELGNFGPVIMKLKEQGPKALGVGASIMSQNPDFQDALTKAGFK